MSQGGEDETNSQRRATPLRTAGKFYTDMMSYEQQRQRRLQEEKEQENKNIDDMHKYGV